MYYVAVSTNVLFLWLTEIMEEKPAKPTVSDGEHQPDDTSAAASGEISVPTSAHTRLQRAGKKRPNKADDAEQFNKWLVSEIEKNSVKTELNKGKISKISAEKELIELMKEKTSLEIQNLKSQTIQHVLFGTEF